MRQADKDRKYGEGDYGFDHLCQICGKEFPIKQLCQDHHHKTGQIRGALCRFCNFLIGFAQEDEETLVNAIEYLAFWRKKRVLKK